MDLKHFPRWRALRAKLTALQNKAVGTPNYNHREWDEATAAVEAIAREGVGEPDRVGEDDITVKVRPDPAPEGAQPEGLLPDPVPPDPEPPA